MKRYDHTKIEKKWQKDWDKKKVYKVSDSVKKKDNFYLLVEFPYPSGNLHVGHWYAFSVPDILARTMRMQGKNVLYPIGFDAFGLPAENAAIKNKLNPRKWTLGNIAYMRKQMQSMGTSFDWSREVITCVPEYYKWTQWQFLQFFKNNLAYRKNTPVNWCPSCKTVLANEQVEDGKCERCKTEVIQKEMLQWNLRITDYADRLIDDLKPLNWPEQIKESQRNWIGRSEGAILSFKLKGGVSDQAIEVFTTRADTLYGVTYVVLAPEHPLVAKLASTLENKKEVDAYVLQASKKTELERQTDQKEKTGVELKGVKAINPATGKEIPVWIADYALAQYGTGAVMAVPAHDERDFAFAQKFNLPIVEVVQPLSIVEGAAADAVRPGLPLVDRHAVAAVIKHWEKDEYLCLRWKGGSGVKAFVTGGIEKGEESLLTAQREIREETGYLNAEIVKPLGGAVHAQFYSLYRKENRFGHYIPFLFQLKDGAREEVAQTEKDLHEVVWIKRDEVAQFLNRGDMSVVWSRAQGESAYAGKGILTESGDFNGMNSEEARVAITERFGKKKTTYKLRDWIVSRQRYWGVPIPIIHCAKCGPVAVPDKDLPVKLPEIKDYLPDGSGKSPLAKATKWVNVKCPECKGKAERETDTLDTFVDSSWYFLRYTDPKNKSKFADAKKQANWMPIDLYSGGAEHTTMHVLYSRFWHKALFDLGLVKDAEPYTRRMNRSLILGPDGQKMSKSRGNVIDPDKEVAKVGSDTVRMYLAFVGPYNEVSNYPWNPDGVVGVRRFLERIWNISEREIIKKGNVDALDPLIHKTIKKVTDDISALKFNTAISSMMILMNAIEKEGSIGKKQWETLLRLLAPFAPHMTEELWRASGNKKSIHLEKWPAFDAAKLKEESITIAIQVNGKTRGETKIAADTDKAGVEAAAKEAVKERLEGKEILRTIVVPNRLVNFVIRE